MIKKFILSILLCFCVVSSADAGVSFVIGDDKKQGFFGSGDLVFEKKEYKHPCIERGYTTTQCSTGYILDRSSRCTVEANSIYYKNCICDPCAGYPYKYEEATASGYHAVGDTCNSCGTIYYKREANTCSGYNYDTTNCGIDSCQDLAGGFCLAGSTLKYEKCVTCPTKECPSGTINPDTYWCYEAIKCVLAVK